jgi:hypothetical protein
MDKVKLALAVTRRFHFWALCGCFALVAPICWWFAASSLGEQCSQKKSDLDGLFKKLNQRTISNVSNPRCIGEIGRQERELKKEVYNAWSALYKEQKKNNPLPEELGPDFKNAYEELPVKGRLDEQYREWYRNYLRLQFPDLLKIGDIRRPDLTSIPNLPGAAGSPANPNLPGAATPPANANPLPISSPAPRPGPFAGGGELFRNAPAGAQPNPALPGAIKPPEVKWLGTVEWTNGEYEAIRANYILWQHTPSTLRVTLAQEDLWVYEALLRTIQKTNQRAAGPAIKRIINLQIGAPAAMAWGATQNLVFMGTAKATAEAAPTMRDGPQEQGMSFATALGRGAKPLAAPQAATQGPAPATPASPTDPDTQPGDAQLMQSRYVDDNGIALPVGADPPYSVLHPYSEFKMMPIRMDLSMDVRKLPLLLAECANSSMPIEVRRVRIHETTSGPVNLASLQAAEAPPTTAPAPGSTDATSGRDRGSGLAAFLASPPGGTRLSVGPAQPAGQADSQDVTPYDISIDVQGIIYIYNPPNEQQLGKGWEAEKGKEPETQGENAATAPAGAAAASAPKAEPSGGAQPPATAAAPKEPARAPATPAADTKTKDAVLPKSAPANPGGRP